MFTGIVEEIGTIKEIIRSSRAIRLSITCSRIMDDVNIGDSIAVNGICLTVSQMGDSCFSADVMAETMRRTGLSRLRVSDKVNLERALKISSRLGGHIVSGHIDGTGILVSRFEEDNALWLTIEAEISILKYMVMKGSVTLDGVSLTIAHLDEKYFKVSLIPHTAGETTLGSIRVGEQVNIECDLIGKYVERFVSGDTQESKSSKDISIEFLRSNGFA